MDSFEFLVPEDTELLEAFGVASEAEGTEDSTRVLRITAGADEEIVLSYDIPGRSIYLRYSRAGVNVVEIFREGATRFSVGSQDHRTSIRADLRVRFPDR
nr:hypothetical protein OH826_30735 [Streptomyces sp. NBC_00899]